MNRDTSIQCIRAYVELLKEERVNSSQRVMKKLLRRKAHFEKEIAAQKPKVEEAKGTGKGAAVAEATEQLKDFETRLALCESEIAAAQGDFPGVRVLEALSATGLRSIRYAQEIPEISA